LPQAKKIPVTSRGGKEYISWFDYLNVTGIENPFNSTDINVI